LHAANQADPAKQMEETARATFTSLDLEVERPVVFVSPQLDLPHLRVALCRCQAKAFVPPLRHFHGTVPRSGHAYQELISFP
jgi:hypothetical protein